MEFLYKSFTEPGCYIYLSGVIFVILGATIGIATPDSRKKLNINMVVPLFIGIGLMHIFRSFDYLVNSGTFIKSQTTIELIMLFFGLELGRRNFEAAFNRKTFSPYLYVLVVLLLSFLVYDINPLNSIILKSLLFLTNISAVVITLIAIKTLPKQSRFFIRVAFLIATLVVFLQFVMDLSHSTIIGGHYKPLSPDSINFYYAETFLAFLIAVIVLRGRYLYEKTQKLHRPSKLILLAPTVVLSGSLLFAITALVGSTYFTEKEIALQRFEGQVSNQNFKHIICERFDFAISSAHLMAENPLVSIYLESPKPLLRNSLKRYLKEFGKKNPHMTVYFMDTRGQTLISSEIKPIIEGMNFADREYFINGIKGETSCQILRGRYTKTIGFYVGHPIRSIDGKKIIGVVAVKNELTEVSSLVHLSHYPTMIADIKNNGRIIMSSNPIYLDQQCGNLAAHFDKGMLPVSHIPMLSSLSQKGAFFSVSQLSNTNWCVITLSHIGLSAANRIWMFLITILIVLILYIILYGITSNSESLKAAETAQGNFKRLFDHAPEPICVIDYNTTEIIALNQSMQEHFGYEENLLGKKLDNMLIASNHLNYNISGSLDVVVSECQFKKANDEVFSAEVTASYMELDNREALLLSIHDITIFKEAEEKLIEAKNKAEEANNVKNRFFANASHEIRTPMTAIIGLSELAASIDDCKNQKDIIELLRISSKSLMSLINDIFGLSEIQKGGLKITKNTFRLKPLIDEVISYTSFQAKRNNKSINCNISRNIPEYVNTDQDHLRQVLLAIINHSSRISRNDNTYIDITFRQTDEDAGEIYILISGLDENYKADMQSISDVFSSDNPYIANKTRKYALGVSLNEMIISQMGGHISLIEGSGSSDNFAMKIVIPAKVVKNKEVKSEENTENFLLYSNGKQLNFLIADDNEINLYLACTLVTRFKGRYKCVNNGLEVLKAVEKEDFDAILLDIQMPKMNGMEVLKSLKNTSDKTSRIPVIAVSAFASAEENTKIIEAGAQEYLSKPYFPKDLQRVIASLFKLDKELPDNALATETNQTTSIETKKEPASGLGLKHINYDDFKLRISPTANSIKKLCDIYNKRYMELDIAVDESIANSNSEKLRETAHSIKGLVGMLSAKDSWEIAKSIEKDASDGKLEEAVLKISELRLHLAEINEDLELIKKEIV